MAEGGRGEDGGEMKDTQELMEEREEEEELSVEGCLSLFLRVVPPIALSACYVYRLAYAYPLFFYWGVVAPLAIYITARVGGWTFGIIRVRLQKSNALDNSNKERV